MHAADETNEHREGLSFFLLGGEVGGPGVRVEIFIFICVPVMFLVCSLMFSMIFLGSQCCSSSSHMCSLGVFLRVHLTLSHILCLKSSTYISELKGRHFVLTYKLLFWVPEHDSVFFDDQPINKKQKLGSSSFNEKYGKI
jgi:hypothetical protein